MGEVYLARDSRLNRNVALKILPSDSPQDGARKRRFVQEARSASALNHPNILTIHDFGTIDGISYIVSELVEGESLRTLIGRGPTPLRRLLDLGIQIADGLTAAHRSGIVHRDLKPENIMVTPGGRVKILDFGLAKAVDAAATLEGDLLSGSTSDGERTQPGLILGTVGYMSPEQARGLPVTVQSDQFSFGIILHEMATGQHPFRRETPMQTLLEIANVTQPPFTPGPVAFRMLVARCLAREPKDRFSDTSEIFQRLKRISDELPELAAGNVDTPIPAPKRDRRRSRLWAVSTLAAVLVFCLGLLTARILPHRGATDLSNYRFSPLAGSGSLETLPALSPNATLAAYSAYADGAFQVFTRPLASPASTQVTHASSDCLYPFWSPDGKRVFYVSGGTLWSVGAAGGSPQLLFTNVLRAAISPDGHTFALLRNDVASGQAYALFFAPSRGAIRRYDSGPLRGRHFLAGTYMAFAPNGKLGLWTSQENGASEFWIIAKPDAEPRAANHMPPGRARMFAWLPDSAHVVFSDGRTLSSGEHLWLAHVPTGALHEITTGTGREEAPSAPSASDEIAFASANVSYGIVPVPLNGNSGALDPGRPRAFSDSSPAWSPVAAEYAYVTDRSGQPEIWLKDTHSGWERPIVTPKEFPDRSLFLGDLAFSDDGQRLAYRRQTEKSEAIWVSTLNGEAPLRLAREPGDAFQRGPTWSPDGNWIAYCSMRSGKYALMKAPADGSGTPALIRLDAGVRPAWSPRGDVIATVNGDGIGLVNADGSAARTVGAGQWLTATWSKHGDVLFGLRRSPQQRLELAMLDPHSGNVSVRADLGAWPAAFSYAAAMDLDPICGASISADGKTLLTSVLNVDSDLWLLSGYKK